MTAHDETYYGCSEFDLRQAVDVARSKGISVYTVAADATDSLQSAIAAGDTLRAVMLANRLRYILRQEAYRLELATQKAVQAGWVD